MCVDADGAHVLIALPGRTIRLWLPDGLPEPDVALVAILELDLHAGQRAATALTLWRLVTSVRRPRGRGPPRREAVIRGEVTRRVLILRALDGRLSGASYRAIAEELFGPERVASEAWRTSTLRAKAIRLVTLGQRLMRGGYHDLLKPPLPNRKR